MEHSKHRLSILFVLAAWALIFTAAAHATSPTKEPDRPATQSQTNSQSVAANSGSVSTSAGQAVSVSERSIGIGLGAGSAHYTGACVVPKKGRNGRTGFLERGFTLPLLRLDPAVEVDEACVSHQREMERLALELERERLELERTRLENCLTCGDAK